MDSINHADGLAAARQQLAEIWADPRIKAFARGYARDPQVADDALQSAYLAMARLKHLDQIDNLRAYFCRVLVRAVHHERGQLGALVIDDFTRLTDEHDGAADSRRVSPTGFEDDACTSVQAWSWHKRLVGARDQLMGTVSARSDDHDRYRTVIFAAAEQILLDGISGEQSEADTSDAFIASYPEYFDQPGASRDACHQRLGRARADVRKLLRAVVR
jgi:DNA-directed RNA polymerase specialized sigma24 family protein